MATTDKYDRQLRLWGAEGQRALMEANCLMINAGPTGSETLKNLVLPGIGKFTVLDGQTLQTSDLGNNFFAVKSALGQPRAKVVTELLLELNSDVKGEYRVDQPCHVIRNEPSYFDKFSIVVASQLPEPLALQLAEICALKKIPLMLLQSFGLIGYVRVQVQNHTIVQSKPDRDMDDLRLSNPFPELRTLALSVDLDNLDSMLHAHVPYVIILIQLVEQWKLKHDGKLPTTLAEKDAFKKTIQAASRGSWGHEVNFMEALNHAYKAYVPSEIPHEVQEVLSHVNAHSLSTSSSNFWILVHALNQFIKHEGGGALPVSGHIPDMTSTTENYIELQRVYQEKHVADKMAIQTYVYATLEKLGLPKSKVSMDEMDVFCKHAACIRCVNTQLFSEELKQPNVEDITMQFMTEPDEQCPAIWYFLLRAAHAFYVQHGRYPGLVDDQMSEDSKQVGDIVQDLFRKSELDATLVSSKHTQEVTRYEGAEIHNIASLVGGIASQEAVKLITHQFTPLNNTYIFNGITGSAGVYNL